MTTDVLQLLRLRRRDRDADAARAYWSTLAKIASGDLSERAAETAVAELDKLSAQLGRAAEQVEDDLASVRELVALDAPAIVKAAAGLPAEFAAVDREIATAEAALNEASRALDAARNKRHPVSSRASAINAAASRIADLRRKLVAEGCPAAVRAQLAPETSS